MTNSPRLRALVVAAAIWLTLLGRQAWAEQGRVVAQVVNGTTQQPVAGLEVTLHTFVGMAEQEPANAVTDADGRVAFQVTPVADASYWLTATYSDVRYASDLTRVEGDQAEVAVALHVYETTNAPSAIEIARTHLLADFGEGELRVAEMVILSNLGDRTFVGDGTRTVQFLLPEGAANVRVDEETAPQGRFVLDGGSVWDTAPLPPGTSVAQHVVGYSLPYDPKAGLNLRRSYPYPVARLNLLVPDVGVEVASEDLAFVGPMGNEQVFLNWKLEGLAAGKTWSVRLLGQPKSQPAAAMPGAAGGQGQSLPLWLGGGAAFSLAAGVLLYLGLRRRASSADSQRLVDAIAHLDDDHEAGHLDEAAYQHLRGELKARLAGLLRQQGQG